MSGQPSPFTSHHPYSSQDFTSSAPADTTSAHPSSFTNQTPPDSASDNSPSPNPHHQSAGSATAASATNPPTATPSLNLPFNPPYTTDAHGRRHGQSSTAAATPYDITSALTYNGQRQLVPEELSGIPTPSTPSVSIHSSPYPGAPAVNGHAGPPQQIQANHPQYPPQPPVYHQSIPSPESYYPQSASGSASRAQIQAQSQFGPYYPVGYHAASAVPPDDPNAACNLNALSDGPPNSKPPYPYSTIIRYAIQGSPRGRLTLSELYETMENRFPWFKTAGNGWKNSVRHNLSLNRCFEKESRPITEPGKGSYWIVNPHAPEGNRRVRKRRPRKPKSAANAATSAEPAEGSSQDGTGMLDQADNSFSSSSSGHGATAMDVNPSDLAKSGSHSPTGSPGPSIPAQMGHEQDPSGRWAGGLAATGAATSNDTPENHFGTGEAGQWTNSAYPGDPTTAVNGFPMHIAAHHSYAAQAQAQAQARPLSRSAAATNYPNQTSTPPSSQSTTASRSFTQLGYPNGAESGHLTPVSVGAGGGEQSPGSVPIASSNTKIRPGHPYKTPTGNGNGSKTNSPPS